MHKIFRIDKGGNCACGENGDFMMKQERKRERGLERYPRIMDEKIVA